MKKTKNTMRTGLLVASFVAAFSTGTVFGQVLHVDSVKVDSVWNTDSSWTAGGVAQQRLSRDCKISFIPQGGGAAIMSVTMSVDSGKTFSAFSDTMLVKGYSLYSPLPTGIKAQITVRVLGGNRPGVAFKMTARQEAPVIGGNPKTTVLGPTAVLTSGTAIQAKLNIMLTGDSTSYGYSRIAKVYWDTLANGKQDSTNGQSVLSWTWNTKVPAGATAQTRKVIARAIDYNGLISEPETLSVQFGLHRQVVMKDILAGTFSMGNDTVAPVVHQVTLSAFSMQETPVTQEQFLSVMSFNPAFSVGDLNRPVENVTWYDAVLFCNKLSKLSGLDTCYTYTALDASDAQCDFTKKGYRLPTEAEFEYACRGGTTTSYFWGPDSNGLGAHVYTPPYGSISTTVPVASKLPNQYGLYDINGNGWKWCNDWYLSPYSSSSAVVDPKGPATAVTRVLRGGAWLGSFFVLLDFYRSAYRDKMAPGVVNSYCGLMCVRSH